jgi:hypothetical protein
VPEFVGLSVDPTDVDTRQSDQTITATAYVTEVSVGMTSSHVQTRCLVAVGASEGRRRLARAVGRLVLTGGQPNAAA